MATDYDSPWKEALDLFFEAFLALLFPKIHAQIDWSRGYEMLDKEFQQVVRQADLGRRYVDKLVKVWTRDGAEYWVQQFPAWRKQSVKGERLTAPGRGKASGLWDNGEFKEVAAVLPVAARPGG